MTSPIVLFLAEDNTGDVIVIQQALKKQQLDFEMFVAEDGEKAKRLFERAGKDLPPPHVILLDLNLPRVEGSELFSSVRENPLLGDVPIIVVTSSAPPSEEGWAQRLGVTHYFRKPSDLDEYLELGAIVKRVVKGQRVQ